MAKLFSCAAVVCASAASVASAQLYDFSIKPIPSGLDGSLTLGADTTGTLIGNYDELNNPTGTRTKPGIFGTFGPAENVPVPVTMSLGINQAINSSTSGAFRLGLNQAQGTAVIENFAANFLHGGAVQLPITLSLLYDSFRTRSPSSTYIGGIPLQIPFGEASLTTLTATQVGPGAGTITQTGPGQFDFVVAPIVQLTAEFSILENTFTIPGLPLPLALGGQIVTTGGTATLTSLQPLSFTSALQPNQALPQIPLDLPTILPPGETAHLLLDMVLSDIEAGFEGDLNLTANGVLVPAPGGLLAGLAGGVVLVVRRRRR